MSLFDLLRHAMGVAPEPRDDQPAMASIQIFSTAPPAKRASGSRSPRAEA